MNIRESLRFLENKNELDLEGLSNIKRLLKTQC